MSSTSNSIPHPHPRFPEEETKKKKRKGFVVSAWNRNPMSAYVNFNQKINK